MILLRTLKIKNYMNLPLVELENLKDLNIIIGPNNSGKTSLLHAVSLLSRLSGASYTCSDCQNKASGLEVPGWSVPLSYDDIYLHKPDTEVEVSFSFNEEEIEKYVPGKLGVVEKKLTEAGAHCANGLCLKGKPNLITEHLSPFADLAIVEELKKSVLLCPERRLQTYGDKRIPAYMRDRNFTGSQWARWIDFLKKLVDPLIRDHIEYPEPQLIRRIGDISFKTSLEEQGSGVRSLACLAADIISEPDAKIVLMDEPELGLDPLSKQAFLTFLIEEAKTKQIFIATHDPTFVNPTLWKNGEVAVLFYSLYKGGFVSINLEESEQDPQIFAGYLPHTTSLADRHLYVEGSSDVYILQAFLRRFCQHVHREIRPAIPNRVEICHLAGDFWPHLLQTIPKPPSYRCLVLLDGDKRDKAKEVCQKYSTLATNTSKFVFCPDLGELEQILDPHLHLEEITYPVYPNTHPIYCLQKNCIEEYLDPVPPYLSASYNKKVDGPEIAEKMESVPEEISTLFYLLHFGW